MQSISCLRFKFNRSKLSVRSLFQFQIDPFRHKFSLGTTVRRDMITMEKVRSSLHPSELQHKAPNNLMECICKAISVRSPGLREKGKGKHRRGTSRSLARKSNKQDACHRCGKISLWKNGCPKNKGNTLNANDVKEFSNLEK